jgi:hypothetical protein
LLPQLADDGVGVGVCIRQRCHNIRKRISAEHVQHNIWRKVIAVSIHQTIVNEQMTNRRRNVLARRYRRIPFLEDVMIGCTECPRSHNEVVKYWNGEIEYTEDAISAL